MTYLELKKKVKKFTSKYKILYFFIFNIYKIIMKPIDLYSEYTGEKIRRSCYKEYENGNHILKINYAGVDVIFKTISPKNFFHLKIGSQYENIFFKKLFNLIKKNMIILDIGGHTGMYTMPFGKLVGPQGKVYCFEPERLGFEAIKENIKINNLDNVKVFNYAISDRNGVENFYTRPDKDTHSLFEKTPAPSSLGYQEKIKVSTFTVDELLKKQIIDQPDLIKIDTEGAEIKILDGLKTTCKNLRYIFLEIHPLALRLEKVNEPEKIILEKLNFLGFNNISYFSNCHVLAKKE